MKTNSLIILSLMLTMSIRVFSQDCPCVKTAVIGNDANATFIHNNKVETMPDTTIEFGSSVSLKTLTCIGKATWLAVDSNTQIFDLDVKPTATTEFIVKSALTGCPDVYDTVKISVKSSLGRLNQQSDLSVFPNPTKGSLTISCGEEPVKMIEICDINGKIVFQSNITMESAFHEINIVDLNGGIYFINITLSDNSTQSKQIIKN